MANDTNKDIKKIELLTKDLKLIECATISAKEARATEVPETEARATEVPEAEAACATPGAEACSVTNAPGEKSPDFVFTNLQEIAKSIDLVNAKYAIQLNDMLSADLSSITEEEMCDHAEKKVEMHEKLEIDYKKYFDDLAPVMKYVLSVGTDHLSAENKEKAYMNVRIVRTDIKSRCKRLHQIKSNFENVRAFLCHSTFDPDSSQFERVSCVITNLSFSIGAIELIMETLEKYDGIANTILERLIKSE